MIFVWVGYMWWLFIIFVLMFFIVIIMVYGFWLKIFFFDLKFGYWVNYMIYKWVIVDGKILLG